MTLSEIQEKVKQKKYKEIPIFAEIQKIKSQKNINSNEKKFSLLSINKNKSNTTNNLKTQTRNYQTINNKKEEIQDKMEYIDITTAPKLDIKKIIPIQEKK